MSGKIKGKDLSYDKALPPFLQRLHAQKAGSGDADRHEREIARPRRAKAVNDDDNPTIVDERGETLSKDAVDELTRPTTVTTDVPAVLDGSTTSNTGVQEEASKIVEPKVSTGAAPKKRKAVVIAGNDGDAAEQVRNKAGEVPKKSKKKAKVIKLAFDDDEVQ